MMNLLSKKLIAFFVILGIVLGYAFLVNNNSFSVRGATITTTPARQVTPTRIRRITPTPTPRRITPTPRFILNPTIPPGVIITFYIEKVSDASETGTGMGRFRLWSTQTGPVPFDGYVTVKYTISGSATNGVDYLGEHFQPLTGSISVAVGNPPPVPTGHEHDNLYIDGLPDNLIEGTETVTITLTDVNVGPGQGSATLNIIDGPIVTPTATPTKPPTSTPFPPITVTPTATPGVPDNYVVNYTIQSDWGNGATIQVTIKNDTTTTVAGWILAWTFPGNQTITNLWNGTSTQSGASVSVRDGGFNNIIPAGGGTASFGFNINYSGSNLRPTSFTLNGTSCLVQ